MDIVTKLRTTQPSKQLSDEASNEIARLRTLVQDAYNEGFGEGMREHHQGGKPWRDSRAAKRLPLKVEEET